MDHKGLFNYAKKFALYPKSSRIANVLKNSNMARIYALKIF